MATFYAYTTLTARSSTGKVLWSKRYDSQGKAEKDLLSAHQGEWLISRDGTGARSINPAQVTTFELVDTFTDEPPEGA